MNNDEKHIESLLDLFMQGETTLEQERELRQFFASSHSVPKEWEPYKEMMAYFDEEMPINKGFGFKKNIVHPLWAVIAAAAVSAIIIMIVPKLGRSHDSKNGTQPTGGIIADVNSANRAIEIDHSNPITAKVVNAVKRSDPPNPKNRERKQQHYEPTSRKALFDDTEIEREKGEMEQAHQELMADKCIIERELNEIHEEQQAGRTQVYRVQQAFRNENPQIIQVVFK